MRGFGAAMTGELSVGQEHSQSDVDALATALEASQQAIGELRAEVAELRT